MERLSNFIAVAVWLTLSHEIPETTLTWSRLWTQPRALELRSGDSSAVTLQRSLHVEAGVEDILVCNESEKRERLLQILFKVNLQFARRDTAMKDELRIIFYAWS